MTFSSARGHRGWPLAFVLAIPAVYGLVLIAFCQRVGGHDYDQFLVFHELQYWNSSLFGLAKQWTPVLCSGLSLAGEPQVPFASLTMLLAYAIGPLPGMLVGIAIYLALGWVGAYLYSGLWFPEPLRRALAASLFIGNGFFICRLTRGHLDFVPFLALPLALWVIHRATVRPGSLPALSKAVVAIMLLGCLFTVVIDGSPVAIIHWIFWIGLYSVTLSWVRRSVLPAAAFIAACAIASLLDAGYLWPMLNAQGDFPRLTADTFTGPWSLPWFMLIPMRGKLLPANGNGVELSVFIGPVLFYLIWRYRHALRSELPTELKWPLLVVSVVSVWLGMGSLHVVHVPVWLSPFDWLRPLPGFRSMGVTGRYWGFLALPLSLLAGAALWRFVSGEEPTRRRSILIASGLVIQLTFQGQSLLTAWLPSRAYTQPALDGIFKGELETILALENPGTAADPHEQGEFITPTRAIVNCYDMDDFTRASVQPGTHLIKNMRIDAAQSFNIALDAGFLTWNHIRILPSPSAPAVNEVSHPDSMLQIELNQAYHERWSSPNCAITRGAQGNLVANCPVRTVQAGAVDLTFHEPVSELGTRVSLQSLAALGVAMPLFGLLSLVPKRREFASPAAVARTTGSQL
jgi:hypothetical protein